MDISSGPGFQSAEGCIYHQWTPKNLFSLGAICEPWLDFLESVRNLTLCYLCHWLHVPFETDTRTSQKSDLLYNEHNANETHNATPTALEK